jgi:Domain of unknown function (DUF4326)
MKNTTMIATARPVRLRLSRMKGYSLRGHSLAVNGLPAIVVSRPSVWGNPFWCINEEGWPLMVDKRDPEFHLSYNHQAIELLGLKDGLSWRHAPAAAVALFRARCVDGLPSLESLRGNNLACWCSLGAPCHADVLLEMANRPQMR